MTIKDVEKLTGLTAKSIRYYESKKLIKVARNKDNSYREYTEDDVDRLKLIKVLRYLEFSIEEIGEMLEMNVEGVKESLQQKADTFSKQKNLCEDKKTLCLSLAKEYEGGKETVEEYVEAIEFFESEEMTELREELEDYAAPSLIYTIIQTLILMAPSIWLFYNIKTERTDMLMFNSILALIGVVLTTLDWVHYIKYRREDKERVKRKNRKTVWMIPITILSIVLGIMAFGYAIELARNLMAPKDYLFTEHGQVTGIILIWLIMIPVILICTLVITKIKKISVEEFEKDNDILYIWNHMGKWKFTVIAVWILAMYCCMTNFTVVTEDKIICHSPLDPAGIEYKYSDVESINTGFGDKYLSIAEYKRKGNFFYQIQLDGKIITFHVPDVNYDIDRYVEHTYLELEEFDRALMELEIPKKADKEGYENCDFDKEYVDRFLRIIESK